MGMKITIPLSPTGQMRPRFTRTGRAYKHKKQIIRESILAEYLVPHKPKKLMQGPLSMIINAAFPIPKSWPAKKSLKALAGEILPTVTPDADNIAKQILDVMERLFFDNDKQICWLSINKFYSCDPGWEIHLEEMK